MSGKKIVRRTLHRIESDVVIPMKPPVGLRPSYGVAFIYFFAIHQQDLGCCVVFETNS